jgi:hypothetical protein
MLTLVFARGAAPASDACRKVGDWIDDCGRVLARAFSRRNLHWIEFPGVGKFGFSAGSSKVRVWPDPEASHETIFDAFSRFVQPIVLQALGQQVLHAGAAVGPAGVLAFCGAKGSGKSTLAFAMQQAGWQQFADDALILRFDKNCVTACPIPFAPRLRPDARAHFAAVRGAIARAQPQLTNLPLAAVFLMQQDGGLNSPRVSLMRGGEAFSKLLAHAHYFDGEDPKHMRQLLQDYLEVVARVPVFTLEYRHNFQWLPQLTRAVVEAAISADAGAIDSSKLAAIVS